MTERDALLAAVCENPDEDTPRLVFADWVQENGEEERAEFIRLQIELAGDLPPGPRRSWLMTRTHRVLRVCEARWRAELPAWANFMWGKFDRGFVESLMLFDLEPFRSHAEAIFASVPLRQVEFIVLRDPGALADIQALSRVRSLVVRTYWPAAESLKRFATAPYLAKIEQVVVLGPTMDFALEDWLSDKLGSKLQRGI